MKQVFIVANWKENRVQTSAWFEKISNVQYPITNKIIVICPPFTLLSEINAFLIEKKLPIQLGAQNISQFPVGAHTGEEAGEMIKELADYVIIGHSERRAMGETNDIVNKKIEQALSSGLTPIICVSEKAQAHAIPLSLIDGKKILIAYEPLEAIGSGHPDSPENANETAGKIKKTLGNVVVLYGGSVTPDNVHAFTSQEYIDGVLVGGASLDPEKFAQIILNA